MIQQEYKNNVVETQGVVETTGFNIEVNESMFQMLTSNVYNDPKLAVMREWSTNACDACIAAGKEIQFDVHLPTVEETYFSVRDYGTGLSPEDVKGIFSNLGASTKRNSNAYNGTLGIGRMAGLAVADAFTVESFYNGTCYSYIISMQNGVPVTIYMGDFPTNEPNGLQLKVDVELEDISAYTTRAEKLYQFFDHKPNINRENVNIHLDVSHHISEDWFITKNESVYRNPNYVVMSQVAYEIPRSYEVEDHGFSGLVIKAAPGSVTFNPGRESLSLNKATVDYINKAFERIAEEYIEAARDKLEEADNDYQLMNTYKSLIEACPSDIAKKINPEEYASEEFSALFSQRNSWGSQSKSFHYLSVTSSFYDLSSNLLALNYKGRHYKTSKSLDSNNPISWQEFFFSEHVIIDLKSKFRSALNEMYTEKPLICWQRNPEQDIEEAKETAILILDELGIPYKLASDIIDVNSQNSVIPASIRQGFYASNIYNGVVFKSQKMEQEDIEKETYLYVKLKNTTPIIEDKLLSFEDYATAYSLLSAVTHMPEVKGVAKKYQSYVDTLDNWVDYETFIKEKMEQTVFKKPTEDYAPRRIRPRLMNEETYTLYPKRLQEFYEESKNYHCFTKSSDYLSSDLHIQLAASLGAQFVTYESSINIDLDELNEIYPKSMPVLQGLSSYYDLTSELVSYIANLEEFYATRKIEQ